MTDIINIEKQLKKQKDEFFEEIPNQRVYGVKDEKIGFAEIFVGQNDMAVLRQFTGVCADEKSPMAKFPNDYSLYYLGELNPETNIIDTKPHKLAQASDYVNK